MEPQSQGQIELPRNFEDVDIDHLVVLIADMLERLISHNDRIPLSPCVDRLSAAIDDRECQPTPATTNAPCIVDHPSESLTRFHSRAPPSISVLDYLRRIVKFTKIEVSNPF